MGEVPPFCLERILSIISISITFSLRVTAKIPIAEAGSCPKVSIVLVLRCSIFKPIALYQIPVRPRHGWLLVSLLCCAHQTMVSSWGSLLECPYPFRGLPVVWAHLFLPEVSAINSSCGRCAYKVLTHIM